MRQLQYSHGKNYYLMFRELDVVEVLREVVEGLVDGELDAFVSLEDGLLRL